MVRRTICDPAGRPTGQPTDPTPPAPRLPPALTITAVGSQPLASPRLHTSPHPGLQNHFTRGSLIQLAGGDMKRVEELETEDFIR